MMFRLLRNRPVRGGFFVLILISFLLLPLSVQADSKKLTDVQKTMLLNKPGVVFISHYDTVNLIFQTSAGYPQLAGKTYTVETGSIGSGFVINPEGYILTNGHVVKTPEKLLALLAIASAADQMLKDIVRAELESNYGYSPSDQELEAALPQMIQNLGGKDALIAQLYQASQAGELKIEKTKTDVYVQQGVFVSGKKIPLDKGMKADIRAVDFEGFTEEGEVTGKDIAILKVSGSNLPTVVLGDSSKVQVGDKIYVVGYPGAPTFQTFLSQESRLEASMTSGIISALKTMKDGSQVFQTDAALTHGNSGGPAFNEKGEVIGIASMVAIEEGKQKYGFSYLRPSNIAKEFLSEKNIQNVQGTTDEHYKKGLGYYEKELYRKAIKEFETALRLYPNLLEAQEYIKKSQEGMSDQSFSARILDYVDTTTGIIAGVVIIILIGGGLVLIRVIKKEKKMEEKVEELEESKTKEEK